MTGKQTTINHRRGSISNSLALATLIWSITLAQAVVEVGWVQLAWDPNTEPDVAGYRIYYGSPPGKYNQVIDVGDVTTAKIDHLLVGQTYSFHATCYNTAGLESDPSNSVEYLVPSSVPANNQPVADPLTLTTTVNTPIDLLLTGSDPDDDPLTFHVIEPPLHGSLAGDPPQLTYTPDTDYTGLDSFTFVVIDGTLGSDPALVSITVTAIEDPTEPPPPHPAIQIVRLTQTAEGLLIAWTSVPDSTYQLLYKNSLADPEWFPLVDPVVADGPETVLVDPTFDPTNPGRYYGVRLLE
jgi:hypothetical protein